MYGSKAYKLVQVGRRQKSVPYFTTMCADVGLRSNDKAIDAGMIIKTVLHTRYQYGSIGKRVSTLIIIS